MTEREDPESDIHLQATDAGRGPGVPDEKEAAAGFPVSGWDRYQFVSFLGQGGMGRVYKAIDLRLGRPVALKFIRSDDPQMVRRFLQEARMQARIEHENVCKVHEVGEVQGRHYIAMQYVEGRTLTDAALDLTVDQKVRIFHQIAEGLQAAHHLGMIHRDIKPGNIMIERTEEGEIHPYLMDFGLARVEHEEGMTMTGVAVGTPLYMSPEQLSGAVHTLDRRSDIYSIGATMYEVLSGKPPFEGSTSLDILRKVVEEDAISVRKKQPKIPKDLDTIVMKCLEKEPERRYDSARNLAEDLQRYLAGEPVLARKASAFYRLRKKARKHRAVVVTGTVALVGMMILLGLWIRARWEATEKARIAGVFGQSVREVETILRLAHLSPPHDLSADYRAVEEKMREVEKMMHVLGPAAEGSGNYALGRGHLAHGEYEKALEHLEKAWNLDYHDPQVAYALGLTLGKLYQRQLESVQWEKNPELKAAKKKEAEKEFKDPAVSYLSQARGYLETPGYAEALIAFYEKRYDQALALAQRYGNRQVWLYEMDLLEGDVRLAQGREVFENGDYPKALNFFQQAGEAYLRAAEVGRSDEAVYQAEAERWTSTMLTTIEKGDNPGEALEQVRRACENALKIKPDDGVSYKRISGAFCMMGWYQLYHTGENPSENLRTAIQAGQMAVKLTPEDAEAYYTLGLGYWRKGEYELDHGSDPSASLQEAIRTFQNALKVRPNYSDPYNNMGVAYQDLSRYEIEKGRDPRGLLKKAVEAHENAIRVQPGFSWAYNSMGNAYVVSGDYEISHGMNPVKTLEKAVAAYQQALAKNPNYAYAYSNMGVAYQNLGRYEMQQGRDPRSNLKKAVESNRNTLRLAPKLVGVHSIIGSVLTDAGEYELLSGHDPSETLKEARRELGMDLKADPSYYGGYQNDAVISILMGRWKMKQGVSPQGDLQAGRHSLDRAIELNAADSGNHRWKAELARREAEWQLQQRSFPLCLQAAEDGLGSSEKALKLNPQDSAALAVQGALYEVRARCESEPSRRLEQLNNARKSLTSALQLNSNLSNEFLPILDRTATPTRE